MHNLRDILIVSLCLIITLAACSSIASTSNPPTSIPSAPQPTLPPAIPIPTYEPMGGGVPVFEYNNDGLNTLLVISSMTGKVLDAFPPIPLGQNLAGAAFAPDGRTLALVSGGRLYLIDLPSWKYRTFDIGLHGWLSAVVYSPDGSLLALASGLPRGELRIVDVKSGEVNASAQAGFAIRNVKFTTDGKALMVYGPHLVAEISVGPPQAALFAVSDLSVLWSVELQGIRHGIFPKKPGTMDIYQPGAASNYEPGIAFAPNNDTLYLVHGDEDKLTTVDFVNRKVHTVDVHVQMSWFDQLLSLTAGVAYAKGMDGTIKQAVISRDGNYLFVSAITDASLGLQVIAVDGGILVNKIETEASPTWLSPDGRQIVLSGWNNGTPWTDIYDISSKSIVKHFDGLYLFSTRRLDGKAILVSNNQVNENLSYMTSIDPDTLAITGEWKEPANVSWLLVP